MTFDDDTDLPERDSAPTQSEGAPSESPPDEQEDFARMLEESIEPRSFKEGEMVEGPIVAFGENVAFVDVGGKGEASIDIEELVDPDGDVDVQVGDIVQAVVVSTSGGLRLSHKLARGAATRQRLEDAFRAGLPVEGRVEKVIKGGYEIRFSGQRAFCPISQIDNCFTVDPAVHDGQVYTFRIIEFKEGGKDLVVSRRALLEEAEQEKAEEIRRIVVPGAVLPGRVASVLSYGAFVDLGGGVQGLLHVSEMGWSRVADPNEMVQPGDEITVKVLRVDDDKGKISLGLKQLEVTRVAEFGAFVELEPGVEALAHVSTFPQTGKRGGWKAAVSPGAEIAVEILSFDPEKKRIGVAVLHDRLAKAEEQSDVREFTKRQGQAKSDGLGSLADTLRDAMKKREE